MDITCKGKGWETRVRVSNVNEKVRDRRGMVTPRAPQTLEAFDVFNILSAPVDSPPWLLLVFYLHKNWQGSFLLNPRLNIASPNPCRILYEAPLLSWIHCRIWNETRPPGSFECRNFRTNISQIGQVLSKPLCRLTLPRSHHTEVTSERLGFQA